MKPLVASLTTLLAAAVVLCSPGALAQGDAGSAGYGTGPGMMGGYGGYGMGPGMMGGYGDYGMGPGMMGGSGGYGMGPGMMGGSGGYGMGPGMMGGYGGYGMGSGMMGGYGMGPLWMLDLSDAQRAKINAIADSLRKKHWAIMGQIQDDEAKLRDLYAASEPDPKGVGSVYAHISKLRQEMLEAHVQAMNQARAVLTPEQRNQFDRWRREGRGPGDWGSGGGHRSPGR